MSNEPQEEKTWPELIHVPGRSKQVTTSSMLSLAIHTLPWVIPLILSLLELGALDIKDQDGELLVPIDMIEDPTPAPPPPTPPTATTSEQQGAGSGLDASVKPRDAGADGGPSDAAPLATEFEGGIAYLDMDAGDDASAGFDPTAPLGALGKINAGDNNVNITVNFALVRSHPLGPRVEPIILAIPEWKLFMAGSNVNPYRDWDWMSMYGPSLLDTSKDVVWIHYMVSDAEMEKAIAALIAQKSKGGPFDVGVRGAKAWRVDVQGAERAIIRGQPHCIVIAPFTHAQQFATVATHVPCVIRTNPGEAGRASFLRPGNAVTIFPKSISKLNMWLVPRNSDGGGDLYAEGDCPDPASATQTADEIRKNVASVNGLVVRLATGSVLSGLDVTTDGNKVKMHLPGSKEQIEAIIGLAGARVGVAPPAASSSGP